MKTLAALVALVALSVPTLAQKPDAEGSKPAAAPKVDLLFFGNAECVYMKGKKVKQGLSVATEQGRVFVCCKDCLVDAKADGAAAYAKAYPKTTKIENKTCPVMTGAEIAKDAVPVTWQGYEFKVCCKDCIAAFKKNPDAYLATLTIKDLKDVGNAKCPVSGEDANGAAVTYGGELIRLHGRKEADEFRKDPAKYVEKAKIKPVDGEDKDKGKGNDKDGDKKKTGEGKGHDKDGGKGQG